MINDLIFDYNNWPWSNTSESYKYYKDHYPKVSVVIPSYNQGKYIEETIRSIIYQNYPHLEIIIIDGGSTDNTVDIIKKYEDKITYWISEKDNGQSHAINKGMERATGDWIGWLNSDDCYLEQAFYYLFNEMDIGGYDFIYGNYFVGENLKNKRKVKVIDSNKLQLSRLIKFFYGINYIIPSQSVFIKNKFAKKATPVDENLHYCMDADYYIRLLKFNPKIFKYTRSICFFRHNDNTKTGSSNLKYGENKMATEAEKMALKYYNDLSFIERLLFQSLYKYYLRYSKEPWKYEKCSFSYLLKLIMLHPFLALSDRRILGLLKKKIFEFSGFVKI